ncbi:MAG: endolytic transglycosylase MltG [Patescibacteria group bacterium]
MKRGIMRIGAVLVLGLAAIFFIFFGELKKESSLEQAVIITIPPGAGVGEIADQLEQAGIISSPLTFKTYALLSGSYRHFPSGRFQFEPGMTIQKAVQLLASGTGRQEVEVRLLEGWTIQQMDVYLSSEIGLFATGEFAQAAQVTDSRTILSDQTFEFLKSKPIQATLDGFLFPDTYRLFIDSEPKDLVKKMLDNFEIKVPAELRQKFQAQGLNVFEAVTLASILEREVQTAEDKKIVAGILYDRLRIGMALQVDSTVAYAQDKSGTELTSQDLQTDSPYNTYTRAGLPVGPVSNPGLDSLRAVGNPTVTDYLYFITDPAGAVYYSITYEEHLSKKKLLYP